MLVEELEYAAQSSPSVGDVTNIIWQINSFMPTKKTLEKVRGYDILPVRDTTGALTLRSRSGRFSIIDRQPWADVFEGKLDFLNFNLKEVRTLQPFLSSLDLGSRYLSGIVTEKSSFQGPTPEPSAERTRHFRRRAHALSR